MRKGVALSMMTLIFMIVGVAILGIFAYAGHRAGSVPLIKSNLYAKDVSLLTNSLLSLPSSTDAIVRYPYDFEKYSLGFEDSKVKVTYQASGEVAQGAYMYLNNLNYVLKIDVNPGDFQYIKLEKEITVKNLQTMA